MIEKRSSPLPLATYHFGSDLTASLACSNITAFIRTSRLRRSQTRTPERRSPFGCASRGEPRLRRLTPRCRRPARLAPTRNAPTATCQRPTSHQTSGVGLGHLLGVTRVRHRTTRRVPAQHRRQEQGAANLGHPLAILQVHRLENHRVGGCRPKPNAPEDHGLILFQEHQPTLGTRKIVGREKPIVDAIQFVPTDR